MKDLGTKDLGLIFLLAVIYISMATMFPHLKVNKLLFNTTSLIMMFLFSGYALTAMIYPDENYKAILKKPVLLLEVSTALTLSIGLVLKYFQVENNFGLLILIMSSFTMIFSLGAVRGRIRYSRPIENEEVYYKKNEYYTIYNKKEPKYANNCNINHNEERVYTAEDFEYYEIHDKHVNTDYEAVKSNEEDFDHGVKNNYPFNFSLNKDLLVLDFFIILTIVCASLKVLKTFTLYILGAPFMVLIPGYLFLTVLFPKREDFERLELLGLSIGASLVITSIIGLLLNYTMFGISMKSMIISLILLSAVLLIWAHIRRRKV